MCLAECDIPNETQKRFFVLAHLAISGLYDGGKSSSW